MAHPWAPDATVTQATARERILAQFPSLAPLVVEPMGEGWDNTAFLVNDTYVFRFPRRTFAVPLLAREIALLPLIAPHVPLAIPVPEFVGAPTETDPWPFAGYRRIGGVTACRAHLNANQRSALALPLAHFLRALHAIDPAPLIERGLPHDEIGRLDHAKRLPMTAERAEFLEEAGVIDDAQAIVNALEQLAPNPRNPGRLAVLHGDLYARHVIVDDRGMLRGAIDWGDVHLGEPALDLAVAHMLLPSAALETFYGEYGGADDRTRDLARYRALEHSTLTAHFAYEIRDDDLLNVSLDALKSLAP